MVRADEDQPYQAAEAMLAKEINTRRTWGRDAPPDGHGGRRTP
jgi:hypothetical protein